MSTIFCPQCGTENQESNAECRACAFDFMLDSFIVCPICQFENHAYMDQCKQCGTDLTAVSAVNDLDGENDDGKIPRATGPLPAPPTRKFAPGEQAEKSGNGGESESFDTWLDEVVSSKSDDEFRGESGLLPEESPSWAVGSGLALGDTMELEEESLPDWLKNLSDSEDVEDQAIESPHEPRLASWLDDEKLAKLGRTKDLDEETGESGQPGRPPDTAEADPAVLGTMGTAPIPGQSPDAEKAQQTRDDWLVELAAMGSGSDSGDEEVDDEDTRFVWDESALNSEVGDESPGWLQELTESEDWPNSFSEGVIEEWTSKIDDDMIEADDPRRFVTRPLGHTKELDGVPERLVSQSLPEWLGEGAESTERPEEPFILEEEPLQEPEAADLEEEAFLDFAAWLDEEEINIEETQEMEVAGLPELKSEGDLEVDLEETALADEEISHSVSDENDRPGVEELVVPAVAAFVQPDKDELATPVPQEEMMSEVEETSDQSFEEFEQPKEEEAEDPQLDSFGLLEDEEEGYSELDESDLPEDEEPIAPAAEAYESPEIEELTDPAVEAFGLPTEDEDFIKQPTSEELSNVELLEDLPAVAVSIAADNWLDDLAEPEDNFDTLEPMQQIDDLVLEDQIAEDTADADFDLPAENIEEPVSEEQIVKEPEKEVPTWLARLTNKLLDTFDNDFVNEWFSRDKIDNGKGAEVIAGGAVIAHAASSDEDAALENEAALIEGGSNIDDFYGEAIPDWLRQTEDVDDYPATKSLESDLPERASEDTKLSSFDETEIVKDEEDKLAAIVAAGAAASSDEWLTLLDHEGEVEEAEVLEAVGVQERKMVDPDPPADTLLEEVPVEAAPVNSEEEIEDELEDDQLDFQTDHLEEQLTEELEEENREDTEVSLIAPIGLAGTDEYLTSETNGGASEEAFTMTREQRQQVALLQQLTAAEPRAARTVNGMTKPAASPRVRMVVAALLLVFIVVGWLIPTSLDPISGLVEPGLIGTEQEVYEAIEAVRGRPILVAFEYTPAMAGELDVIAETLLQQIEENGSAAVAVSQIAAGTAMAERMLGSMENLDSHNLGFLPGEAVGLRRFSSCLNGDDSCETIIGEDVSEEALDALKDIGLILILASDRDAVVNWIEQVGPLADQGLITGLIQPLQPIISPYVSSSQVIGSVSGAQSALAYQKLLLGVDDNSSNIDLTALTLAFWFAAAVLIGGSIYYTIKGDAPPGETEGAAG